MPARKLRHVRPCWVGAPFVNRESICLKLLKKSFIVYFIFLINIYTHLSGLWFCWTVCSRVGLMVVDLNAKIWNAGWKSVSWGFDSSFSFPFGAVADHAQAHVNFHVDFKFSSLVKGGRGGWCLCEVFWALQENCMLVTKPLKND